MGKTFRKYRCDENQFSNYDKSKEKNEKESGSEKIKRPQKDHKNYVKKDWDLEGRDFSRE